MPKLSSHFTLEELTLSQTAVRHGISNKPTEAAKKNLQDLAINVLEPIREAAGHPITVSSGFRSVVLNSLVGGAPNSQHVKGEAADINCFALGQQELFDLIRHSDIPFDQVIDEFGSWVHVSFTSRRDNRREVLRARQVNGVTKFTRVTG